MVSRQRSRSSASGGGADSPTTGKRPVADCPGGSHPDCPGGSHRCFAPPSTVGHGSGGRDPRSPPLRYRRSMADLLRARPSGPRRLRELLAGAWPVLAPGAYDALSARLVEQAGFGVVYMTGFGTAASLLGRPDVGLLTATEMLDNARRIVAAVDVPVVADADTGYGNAINVVRTVQLYEQAGVAGIQLEDQVMPKKCGHMSGKLLIGTDEMCGKLRAAVEARRDPDLLIIARTDAVAVTGTDDAIARARAFAEAGADVLFVEAPTSDANIERVAAELRGVAPLVFNWAERSEEHT